MNNSIKGRVTEIRFIGEGRVTGEEVRVKDERVKKIGEL